jgi:hypothetical protein
MKYLVFVCLISVIFPQEDTIKFSLDIGEYQKIANEKLIHLMETDDIYNVESQVVIFNKGWVNAEKKLNKKMGYSELAEYSVLSIPYFWFNDNAKTYKSGDNLEYIIDFKEDPSFQEVWALREDEPVGSFYISYKNEEVIKMRDSTKNQNLLMMNSFIGWNDYVDRNIARYIQENPDIFVFKLKDIAGYWVIKDGYVIRLEEKCFLWFCSISEKNANVYFTETYSEELIRDLATEYSMNIGYHYMTDGKQYDEKDFRKVFIKMN